MTISREIKFAYAINARVSQLPGVGVATHVGGEEGYPSTIQTFIGML
jgi:hypothetical protein